MDNSPSRAPGWLAISMAASILVGIVFYELSFHVFNRAPLLTTGAFLILVGALFFCMSAIRWMR